MLFSIVVPAYNAEKFLLRCVNSVLGQTCRNFELILVNDGSCDETENVARSVEDERVRVISQKNQGVSVARNTGIMASRGDYVCFLDADDEYLPNHLEVLEETIRTYEDKGFFVTNFCTIRLDGTIVGEWSCGTAVYKANPMEDFIRNAEVVWTGCVCIRRDLFDLYGMFEPGVPMGEDRDMWIRVFSHTGAVFCGKTTVKRNRDGSEATKFYTRREKADILNRLPTYLADPTIAPEVKESIVMYYECEKMATVRSFLFYGKKKEARRVMKTINKKHIPVKRLWSTRICFFVPSSWIRWILNRRNKGMFR